MALAILAPEVLEKMRAADVLVPAPLAVSASGRIDEKQQRLLTRYYIECGASSVIPGTHTGQFARGDPALYRHWLELNAGMIEHNGYRKRMFKMAAVGGRGAFDMLRAAASAGYDIVMVAPTALVDTKGAPLDEKDSLKLLREMAEVIPVYGFYLQKAVGGRDFSADFWSGLFEFAYGAKAAPFSREKTDQLMNAAVRSPRLESLVMTTGNDDYIVGDLLKQWRDPQRPGRKLLFSAGLLGHFATDTAAAVRLVGKVKRYREKLERNGGPTEQETADIIRLAGAVTSMNYALFDPADLPGSPPFANCVYGVHYRLSRLGVICAETDIRWPNGNSGFRLEKGRPGLEAEIDQAYSSRGELTDDAFLTPELLKHWKAELEGN